MSISLERASVYAARSPLRDVKWITWGPGKPASTASKTTPSTSSTTDTKPCLYWAVMSSLYPPPPGTAVITRGKSKLSDKQLHFFCFHISISELQQLLFCLHLHILLAPHPHAFIKIICATDAPSNKHKIWEDMTPKLQLYSTKTLHMCLFLQEQIH